MKTLSAVLICILLLPVISAPERPALPTVASDAVRLAQVRRASEMGVVSELSESGDTLLVERPAGATQRSMAGLFVLDEASGVLQRLPVRYGRASGSLIQIVSGVSPGHRIVVSDMSAWDQFERLRLR